jgi:peptide-methionine (S)-S-oxide reductase
MVRFIQAAIVITVLATTLVIGPPTIVQSGQTRVATFAAGCFWCLEEAFDEVDGIISTTSGYMGGDVENPTYRQVSSGRTGHTEVVRVIYDPTKVTYLKLLKAFWANVDPTTPNRQFCDRGSQYRSAIFAHDESQMAAARASFQTLKKIKPFSKSIVTQISQAGSFYPAEDYHQNYYRLNPVRYKFYKYNCGRANRLEKLWKGFNFDRLDSGGPL